MIHLQQIGPTSASILRDLWEDTFREAYPEEHSLENLQVYIDKNFTFEAAETILSDKKTVCKLAFNEGNAVGLCLLIHEDSPIALEGSSTELKQLYIRSSEYGSGLGKGLMKDAIREAEKANRDHLWLCVSDLNYRAQRFYKKFGFTRIGEGPVLEVGTDLLPSSIMVRKI